MDRSLERSKSHASSIDNKDGSIDSELSLASEKDVCCFWTLLDCFLDDEHSARRAVPAYPFGAVLPGNRTALAPRTAHSIIVPGIALSTLRAIMLLPPITRTKDDPTNRCFRHSSFRISVLRTMVIPSFILRNQLSGNGSDSLNAHNNREGMGITNYGVALSQSHLYFIQES